MIFRLIILYLLLIPNTDIKVLSYNVRYNNPNDGKDVWDNRKQTIVDFLNKNVKINGYRAEILGDINGDQSDIRLKINRIKQTNTITELISLEDIEILRFYNKINCLYKICFIKKKVVA